MQSLLVLLFVAGAAGTIVSTMATSVLSVRPRCVCGHVRQIARLSIVAASALGIARSLTAPATVTGDQVLLVLALAVIMLLRARSEAHRQQEGRPC